MLILSRRPGDAILIDGDIRIIVLANDGGNVRIGIEAPSHIGIFREEIVDRIADENRRAGANSEAREWFGGLQSPADGPPSPSRAQGPEKEKGLRSAR